MYSRSDRHSRFQVIATPVEKRKLVESLDCIKRIGMAVALDFSPNLDNSIEQLSGFVQTIRLAADRSKVPQAIRRVQMLLPQNARPGCKNLSAQRFGFFQAILLSENDRELAAGAERLDVFWA